jgi:hypothetical protein
MNRLPTQKDSRSNSSLKTSASQSALSSHQSDRIPNKWKYVGTQSTYGTTVMDNTVLKVRLKTTTANTERLRTKLFRATSGEATQMNQNIMEPDLKSGKTRLEINNNPDLDRTSTSFIFLKTKNSRTTKKRNPATQHNS